MILFITAQILDDPSILAAGVSLAFLLFIRYRIFMSKIRIIVMSLSVTRGTDKRLIRQGSHAMVTSEVNIQVPEHMEVIYQDTTPEFCTQLGESGTHPLHEGEHSHVLCYSIIPLIHGSVLFPGGQVTMRDPFFEIELILGRKEYSGPTLQVQPYPLFDHSLRYLKEGRELERPGSAHGYSIRMFREYLPGDDIRHVDWKISAKRGTTYVREYASSEKGHPLIIVDLPDRALLSQEEEFTRLISAVSGLIEDLLTQKNPFALVLISGPNVCFQCDNMIDLSRFMAVLREQLHPHDRINHFYRVNRRSDIRTRIDQWEQYLEGTEREKSKSFFLTRIIDRYQQHMTHARSSHFHASMARILGLYRITEIIVYSLCQGDLSHIQDIAALAHHRNIRFIVKTLATRKDLREVPLQKRLRGVQIEGL
ncbi:MAG TPA: DUF58 domain-containing protein [Methanospirillum sp.]|nr:DUF58 domain-containing protein [Methanospirillum sp.]